MSENVAVGGTCVSNKQCTGTANSGVCESGTCVCETEYILFDQFCYEGETPFQHCLKVKKKWHIHLVIKNDFPIMIFYYIIL